MKILFLLVCNLSFLAGSAQVKIKSEDYIKSGKVNSLITSFSDVIDTSFNSTFYNSLLQLIRYNNRNLILTNSTTNFRLRSNDSLGGIDAVLYIEQIPRVVEYSIGGLRYEYVVELQQRNPARTVYKASLQITFRFEEWQLYAGKGAEKIYKALRKTEVLE